MNREANAVELRSLDELRGAATACTRCSLYATAKNLVFGVGPVGATLMLVGEAPGKREDELGIPFVGDSGDRLNAMLGEVGLARDDIYLANVLKHRPPRNRDPADEEIASCQAWLTEQVRLVHPKVIAPLGTFAMQKVLGTTKSISEMRGRLEQRDGRNVISTFHPAYRDLRFDPVKQELWKQDFRLIRDAVLEAERDSTT